MDIAANSTQTESENALKKPDHAKIIRMDARQLAKEGTMRSQTIVKIFLSASVTLVLLLLVGTTHAQDPSSFRSWNYPDRYIRHRNSLGYVEKITANDKLGRKDATFHIVNGLAGKCRSFESVNYPSHFLRHQDFRLKLVKASNEELFKKDATFCFTTGLASSEARSFESLNFPKHYIRHSNFELWIAKTDGSQLFRKDATFMMSPPLTEHPPPVRIDPAQ